MLDIELAVDLDGEVWLPVNGTSKYYEVSNLGRVRNTKKGNLLHPHLKDNKYYQITLYKEGGKNYRLNRMVYFTFRGHRHKNWEEIHVHHKDKNSKKDSLDNLIGEHKSSHCFRHKVENHGRCPLNHVLEKLNTHKLNIEKLYKTVIELSKKYDYSNDDLIIIEEISKKIDRQIKKMVKAVVVNYKYEIK